MPSLPAMKNMVHPVRRGMVTQRQVVDVFVCQPEYKEWISRGLAVIMADSYLPF